MFDGPVIVWAASRAASAAEKRIVSQTARAFGAQTRTVSVSSLAQAVVSSIVLGPVVVIVASRKDAATALKLGAAETVRVAQSVVIRKSTLQGALERAASRSRQRTGPSPSASGEYPGLSLLMRVVERRLGSPLNEATLKCSELADELTRAVAVADGLMQQVRLGFAREERKGWSRDVKHYALATLRAETLMSELREQVERGDAVLKLLGDLSADAASAKTDVETLLQQLAELLRADLGADASLEVVTCGPSYVEMARPALLCIVCAAVENALENIRGVETPRRIELRAFKADAEIVIEVSDDGAPVPTDLRASIVDSLIADPRTARLRQLRERVRGMGGELTLDADEGGTLISIYLPLCAETTSIDSSPRAPKLEILRRQH